MPPPWLFRPQLINAFYGGVSLHYQTTLDTSSEGSFSTSSPEEAKRLIKNVATGRSYEMMNVERGREVDSIDGPRLAEIKESLESLHSVLAEQNQFGISQIDNDVVSDLEQHVDFIDRANLEDRHPDPNTDIFTRNYDAIVGSRRGRAKFRLNQAFTGNRKLATNLNRKINIIYSELMRKFDALSEHIKRLDGQVAENATAIKRESGRLPRRTDANHRHQANAVLLKSGKCLIPNTVGNTSTKKKAETEKTGKSRSRPMLLDDPDPGSKPSREKEQSNTDKSKRTTISLDEE
ncbi:hypothetical protein F2Q70_00011495 [Brassica cretica]|uniref:Uncharacterized protein n=1 Tax=Brassica cretica TaxID=69181 RepID=A0A8S9JKE1_BRACR|nr:hypothetical protein F2Q68_00004611 [Brassica cretica]KAF2612525.1 hypothetical protein F2Q70_00011495 [Brassica cretica]